MRRYDDIQKLADEGPIKMMAFKISRDIHEWLKASAKAEGICVSAFLRNVVRKDMKRRERKAKE